MKLRPYQPGDEAGILALDAELFPDPYQHRTPDNWRWKYRGANPAGEAVIWVMEHDGAIVAHFAVIPVRVKYFDHELTASHSIASMVAVKYQNKGLIKFVSDRVLEETGRRGWAFTWGFPNKLAHAYHLKLLKYCDLTELRFLEKVKDTLAVTVPCPAGCTVMPIEVFDAKVDELWQQASLAFPIAVARRQKFLNWRYLSRPDQKYEAYGAFRDGRLDGYIIVKLFQAETELRGHLVDMLVRPGGQDVFKLLVRQAECRCRAAGVARLNTFMLGATDYRAALRELGYLPAAAKPLICRINVPQYAAAGDAANWYFAMGDSLEIF